MQNNRSRSVAGSGRRTALISLGLIGLMGVGLVGLWWTAAMRTPMVKIPSPVMPHPNAFDFYVKAGNAVVNDQAIGNSLGSKPMVSFSLAQKEALVQQNAGVISVLHQGFAHPYLNPPIRSADTLFPYYAKMRGVARLLSFRGQVRAAYGDWNGAADNYLDAIRMGEEIPHGSVMIGDLVGIACQAIGRRPLWETAPHLDGVQSRAACTRLEAIMDRHFSYADTMQEEKWFGQAALLEMFSDSKKRQAFFVGDPQSDPRSATVRSLSALVYLAYSKNRIMENYTTFMDRTSQAARQPYGLHLPPPPMPTDPINRALLPVFAQARLRDVNCETQDGLLLVLLALHAFRLEQSRYPAALTELVPAYLHKLPGDPFAVQGTFKYRVKGQSYVLYSVGPDGVDDGGKPIDDVRQAGSGNKNARYFVNPDSVGDIVAGKNTF